MDYIKAEECDVLFLSDTLKYDMLSDTVNPFSGKEEHLILSTLKRFEGLKIEFQAATKCPSVKESDINPQSREICRQHLRESIKRTNPKLIFACGNLALVMLLKKSGIMEKRGSKFLYEQDGKEYHVVPLIHPLQVIIEPKFKDLFVMDVINGINKYIYNRTSFDLTYTTIHNFEDLQKFNYFLTTTSPIACDTETQGLDFLKHKIHTISIADKDTTIVIPVDHKDSSLSDREKVLDWVKKVLENPNNRKVFTNAKFDLKMLRRYNIIPKNIWDIKTMYHLIQEDAPKSLKELTKRFIPETLEEL